MPINELVVGTVENPVLAGKLILGGWMTNKRLAEPGMGILRSQNYTCASCGFKTNHTSAYPSGGLLPVAKNGAGLVALDAQSGVAFCVFCMSARAINWSVIPQRQGNNHVVPGRLISCPYLDQKELNRLAHFTVSVYNAPQLANTSIRDMANAVDSAMTALSRELSDTIPIYRSDDESFARALALVPDKLYERRSEATQSLRWWPSPTYWADLGVFWYETVFVDGPYGSKATQA